MVRPASKHPTPGELEILQVLWNRGPCTVRQVMNELNRHHRRAYTSVMSLMNIMHDKGILKRTPKGRAFLYCPKKTRDKTLAGLVRDLVNRAFAGSPSELVAHLLNGVDVGDEEAKVIRKLISRHTPNDK